MIPDPRQQPYTLPKTDNGASRRRAFFFVIAMAILLTSIPIVFLVLRGWLAADAPDSESTIVVDMEEPETEAVEYSYTPAVEVGTAAAADAPNTDTPNADAQPAATAAATADVPNTDVPNADAQPAATAAATADAPNTIAPNPAAPAEVPAPPPPPTVVNTLVQESDNSATAAKAENSAMDSTAAVPSKTTTEASSAGSAAPPAAPNAAASEKPEKSAAAKNSTKSASEKSVSADKSASEKSAAKREFRPLSKEELAKLKAANASSRSTPQQRAAYNKKLYSFVRSNWSAPAPSAVGGRKLSAVIEISVAADGTVSSVRLKTPSYVKAMDDSVNSLIAKLKRRKAPAPGFATGKITIELKN